MPSGTARSSPRRACTSLYRFRSPSLSTAYVVVMARPYPTTYGVRNYDGGRGDDPWRAERPNRK
ncbi:hypothetical protein BN2537_13697 [Streptomyces venezuelae]|nr:hypothetical protein BN2537_13697 [Streptomyces venezuelae]